MGRFGFVRSLSTLSNKSWDKTLTENIDTSNQEFKASVAKCEMISTISSELLQILQRGGGKKAIERHTKHKLLVNQRLQLLLDKGAHFFELSPFAGLKMDYGDIPKAAGITGIGKINGYYCMVFASDATVKGGTTFPIGVRKQLRAQNIAQQNHIPCIYLIDSGGAFLPLQAELFPDKDHGGRVFYNQAVMSSENIPQISVVCGSCTAGAAYIPTMSDEAVIVNKLGTIFLAGPPLVKAATDEVVSAEELGGATVHCKLSGYTDYFSENEESAFQICREIIRNLNYEEQFFKGQEDVVNPLYSSQELMGLAYPEKFTKKILHQILACVLDGSQFLDFKEEYGLNLITGFGKICGNSAGILANVGDISEQDALKGSHFIQLCNQRGLPLIFLKTAIKQKLLQEGNVGWWSTIKARAKLIGTISTAHVPKITLQLDHIDYMESDYTMSGKSFNSSFVFAWPSVSNWSCDIDQMVESLFVSGSIPNMSGNFFDASRVWIDGLILPQDTRKVLGQILEIVRYPVKEESVKKLPILRM